MDVIYFDTNSSAPLLPSAREAMVKSLNSLGNPSSTHYFGRLARMEIDKARKAVANALGAHEKEIVFFSGASEANRWLIDAVTQSERPLKFVSTIFEHPSLLKPLLRAQELNQISLTLLSKDSLAPLCGERVGERGELPSPSPLSLPFPHYVGRGFIEIIQSADIIIATAAHNETGILIDWESICELASPDAILIADASQALSRISTLPKRIDAIACSSHKIGGPPGIGAAVIRGNARNLDLPWAGGGQEGGVRPGTEAIHLIAGFGAAALEVTKTFQSNQKIAHLRDIFEQRLCEQFPSITIIGKDLPRLPNTSAFTVNGADGDALRIAIDVAGLCVGFGSACSSLAPEPSFALTQMGLSTAQAKATMRVSLHPHMLEDEFNEGVRRLFSVLSELL